MRFILLLCIIVMLSPAAVLADENSPAQTPSNNRAFEIITNAYQGSVSQKYGQVISDNFYQLSDGLKALIEPDSTDASWFPEITVYDVITEIANPWGAGRWEGHSGVTGLVGEMFARSAKGYLAREARWTSLSGDPDLTGKIYKGGGETYYSISIYWASLKGAAKPKNAILEVTGCYSDSGGKWPGTAVTVAVSGTINKYEEASNTDSWWGALDRQDGVLKGWTGAAISNCDRLALQGSSDANYQISPHLVNTLVGDFPLSPEGLTVTWWFDGKVSHSLLAENSVYVMHPGQLESAEWLVDSDGFTGLKAVIGRIPGANFGSALVTLQSYCVTSANCSDIGMKDGNTFHAVIEDNPAAGVSGFGVIAGVAEWDVQWMINSDQWIVKGDSLGHWVDVASISSEDNDNGAFSLYVGEEFPAYGLFELDTRGVTRFYAQDKPVQWRGEAPAVSKLTREELVVEHQKVTQKMRAVIASASATSTPCDTIVVFCPGFQEDEYISYYKEWYETHPYFPHEVITENVDSYPSDPDAFRNHMKSVIANYASDGVKLFQIGGMANWWQQFSQPWPGLWEEVRQFYLNIGLPLGGEPELDDIPTWYFWTDETIIDPDNSMEYFQPFRTSDEPYIDLDEDGIADPGLYIARIPIHDETDLMSYFLKIHQRQSFAMQVSQPRVAWLMGDVDHLTPGDGARVNDASQEIFAALPPETQIATFKESDFPIDSERNTQVSNFINVVNPNIIAGLSSTSWRYSPLKNFEITNPSNPFHMGMLTNKQTSIVLAGSCNSADLVRSWEPANGPPVWYRFLTDPYKGADSWWGNVVGSYGDANKEATIEVLTNLLESPWGKPMAVIIQEAKQHVYQNNINNSGVLASLQGLTYFGDIAHPLLESDTVSGVPDGEVPESLALSLSNYPNPFNPSTHISFTTSKQGSVSLRIFDIRGHLVKTLVEEELAAGMHKMLWNGDDQQGRELPSGLYTYLLKANNQHLVGKTILVK